MLNLRKRKTKPKDYKKPIEIDINTLNLISYTLTKICNDTCSNCCFREVEELGDRCLFDSISDVKPSIINKTLIKAITYIQQKENK